MLRTTIVAMLRARDHGRACRLSMQGSRLVAAYHAWLGFLLVIGMAAGSCGRTALLAPTIAANGGHAGTGGIQAGGDAGQPVAAGTGGIQAGGDGGQPAGGTGGCPFADHDIVV